MKIGVFGGTFDPFHEGHLAIVVKSFEQCGLDKIIIVPTTVNYYRPDKHYLFNYDQKVEIIREFITGIEKDVDIDTIEKDKDGTWRTINLMQYFKENYPDDELYLIIGEDSFKEFTTWTRWQDILKIAKLIVANRSTHVEKTLELNKKAGTEKVIEAIPLDMGTEFEECSATRVRDELIKEVMDMYLLDKGLYGRS